MCTHGNFFIALSFFGFSCRVFIRLIRNTIFARTGLLSTGYLSEVTRRVACVTVLCLGCTSVDWAREALQLCQMVFEGLIVEGTLFQYPP